MKRDYNLCHNNDNNNNINDNDNNNVVNPALNYSLDLFRRPEIHQTVTRGLKNCAEQY